MTHGAWDPSAFNRGSDTALPPAPEGRRDVAVSLYQKGDIALAHEIAFRAIDRFHDKTFDNVVSGEKDRDFLFERGSISTFIATGQELIDDPARQGGQLHHLEEVYLRLDSDRPHVYQHGPSSARGWVDTAICALVIQRHLTGEVTIEQAAESIRYISTSNAGAGPVAVPASLLARFPSDGLRPCEDGDFDPLTYATKMMVQVPQVDTRSRRDRFESDLRRMATENIDYFTKHRAVLEALEPDIESRADFVNIFQASKSKTFLVVTTHSVWLITPKLLRTRVVQIPVYEIQDVGVERGPIRNCISIDLVVRGTSNRIRYEFAFECFHGFDDPVAQERMRIATHNAEVASIEIGRLIS